jgi:hypothetical protein
MGKEIARQKEIELTTNPECEILREKERRTTRSSGLLFVHLKERKEALKERTIGAPSYFRQTKSNLTSDIELP